MCPVTSKQLGERNDIVSNRHPALATNNPNARG